MRYEEREDRPRAAHSGGEEDKRKHNNHLEIPNGCDDVSINQFFEIEWDSKTRRHDRKPDKRSGN